MLIYISKAFEDNIGASMHYKALKEILGEENIYTVDLRPIDGNSRKIIDVMESTRHLFIEFVDGYKEI